MSSPSTLPAKFRPLERSRSAACFTVSLPLMSSTPMLSSPTDGRSLCSTADTSIAPMMPDRKSTRLNSSHLVISYAVFCLKKKKCYQIRLDYCRQEPRPRVRALCFPHPYGHTARATPRSPRLLHARCYLISPLRWQTGPDL